MFWSVFKSTVHRGGGGVGAAHIKFDLVKIHGFGQNKNQLALYLFLYIAGTDYILNIDCHHGL